MSDVAQAAQALRLAMEFHGGMTDRDLVLATAERFYGFLISGQDKTLAQRVQEALEVRDAR